MSPTTRRAVDRVACGVLFLLSLAPYLVAATVLGTVDLIYFAIVWGLYAVCRAIFGSGYSLIMAFLCALALLVPPVPYYLGFLPDGSWHFHFIGWSELVNARFYVLLLIYIVSFLGFDLVMNTRLAQRSKQAKQGSE